MNPSASAAFPIGGSIHPNAPNDAQALRMGMALARASQLTMVRLQLALHQANRRGAMQALDSLLDIDAEMESLAAALGEVPAHQLAGFIGLQKSAIAAEKHALTGGDLRSEAASASSVAEPLLLDDELESDDRAGGKSWMLVLAVAAVILGLGYALIAYLLPAWPIK